MSNKKRLIKLRSSFIIRTAPDIITATKTRRMGWAEHVAWMTGLKTSTKMHYQLRAKILGLTPDLALERTIQSSARNLSLNVCRPRDAAGDCGLHADRSG